MIADNGKLRWNDGWTKSLIKGGQANQVLDLVDSIGCGSAKLRSSSAAAGESFTGCDMTNFIAGAPLRRVPSRPASGRSRLNA